MKRCVLAAVLCLSTTSAWASDGPTVPIDVRAKGSQMVVFATVTNVFPRFGTNTFGDQLILSDLQIDVAETLKGQAGATLTVTVEGGQIGDLTLTVSDMPVMQPGERAIFFLQQAPTTKLNDLCSDLRSVDIRHVSADMRLNLID